MATLSAVYLDLRDLQSARVWRWCRALGFGARIEARPFVMDVADIWDCAVPTLGLELAMLMELARDRSAEHVIAVLEGAFARLMPDEESAHAELTVWLEVSGEAGLDLADYDVDVERLQAEVGYWKVEAQQDHGVVRAPTLLFDDGTSVYVQLDHDIRTEGEARRLMSDITQRVSSTA